MEVLVQNRKALTITVHRAIYNDEKYAVELGVTGPSLFHFLVGEGITSEMKAVSVRITCAEPLSTKIFRAFEQLWNDGDQIEVSQPDFSTIIVQCSRSTKCYQFLQEHELLTPRPCYPGSSIDDWLQ